MNLEEEIEQSIGYTERSPLWLSGFLPLGVLIGVLGSLGSLQIARSRMATVVKVVLMIGVGVLCYVVDLIIVGVLYAVTHP